MTNTATRSQGIGGSEIAAIVGLDPRRDAFSVYADKLELVEREAPSPRMAWGKRIERVIAEAYGQETGQDVRWCDESLKESRSWELMTPDAFVWGATAVNNIRRIKPIGGWRTKRNQRTVVPGAFQSGEPGEPDLLFIRYFENGAALVLWVEMKRPRDRRKCRCLEIRGTGKRCTVCDQRKWRERERARGTVVWVDDSFEWFGEEYGRAFGWLHLGETGRGQLDLLAGVQG